MKNSFHAVSISFLLPVMGLGLLISHTQCGSGLPASGDRFSRFFVRGFAALSLALVPSLLALGQRHLDLYPAIAKIKPGRNQCQTLMLGLANQFVQLVLMHQQLPGAQRFMVEDVAVLVRTDVRVD